MALGLQNIFVKPRGYAFDCDGWNVMAVHATQVKNRDGRVLEIEKPNSPKEPGKNPLLPHSELLKIPNTVKGIQTSSAPDLTENVADIFAEGPGQLHIYPPQDLPK